MPTDLGDFHHPDKLLDKYDFENNLKLVINAVKDGLPSKDACILVFGISGETFKKWVKWYKEDVAAGFESWESNLIKLMEELSKEDARLHRRFTKTAIKLATVDENPKMLQFMLKTRYGYSERNKSEVEISTDKDFKFNINITESKPQDK